MARNELIIRIGADATRLERELKKVENKWKRFGRDLNDVGRRLTTGLTLPILAAGGGALKLAMDWESAFASVRKTVDATDAELADLAAGIRKMSTETPHGAVELANLAAAAGQLGIQTDAILEFTKVVADLGVATENLKGEEAAKQMARFANIMRMSQHDFDRLGSAIVHLGNNLATTEGELMEFGLRIAGAGKIAGLTEAQVLAIGAAMSSVGIEAEAGGTAVQKVLTRLTEAVANGNEHLQVFAAVAGMSAAEFARVFEEDAGRAFTLFVEGLGRSGDQAFQILRDLGLGNERVIRSFLSLANAGPLLRDSLDLATQAWEENTALAEEAEIRYQTLEQQLKQLWNEVAEVGRTLGEALVPMAKEAIEAFKPLVERVQDLAHWFNELDEATQRQVVTFGLFLAAIGPTLLFASKMIDSIAGVIGAIRLMSSSLLKTLAPALIWIVNVPIAAAIAAVGSFAAAGYLLVKNWEDVKMALSLTFEYLWVGFDNMVLKIGYAAAWLSREWNEMLSAILKAAEPIISILPERWQAAFTEMRQAVAFAADRAEADMSRLADAVERNVARVNVAVWQLQQTQAQAAERSQVMARGLRAVREQGSQAAKTVDEAAGSFDAAGEAISSFSSAAAGSAGSASAARREVDRLKDAMDALSLTAEIAKAEFDLWSATAGLTATEADKLRQELAMLTKQHEVATERVRVLEEAYRDMVAAKGEAAEESRKLQLELLKERRAQAELAEQIAATNKVQRERATFAPRIAGMTIAQWADLSVEKGVSVADVMRIWGVPEHEIPSFDTGGVVPGPIGAPRLVLAHGGETILPTHRHPMGGFGPITVNVYGSVGVEDIAERLIYELRLRTPIR